VALFTAPAAAAALPTIVWDAPAGCPDAGHVDNQLRLLVGTRPAPPSDLVREVHARVEPRGDAWLLVLVLVGRASASERQLTLSDCQATATATALLTAIALGDAPQVDLPAPVPVTVPQPPATDPAVTPTAAPQPAPAADLSPPAPPGPAPRDEPPLATRSPAEPVPRVRRIARPRGFVSVGPALALGIVPRATPGLVLTAGAAWPHLRLSLGYTRWFPGTTQSSSRPEFGAETSLHVATLRVGPVRRFGPVELHGGLALEFGSITATGVGSDVTHRRTTWWGATILGGALAFTPRALQGHGALLLQVDGVVPLHRPVLLIDNDVEVHRFGAIGLRAALALEMRFR
jgi:hypothetical protein